MSMIAWAYVLMGFIPIVLQLLASGHAVLHPIDEGSGLAGCPDRRVTKDILVFGGSSAFTFGLQYYLLGMLFEGTLGELFAVYAQFQLILSAIQTITYLLQVPRSELSSIRLKAHLQGCGWTTAWSPLWPLYWLGKIPGLGWLREIRDLLTIADYLVSLPATLMISVLTRLLFGKWTVPVVSSVDHYH